jgi:glutamate:GABA antiporter
MSADDAVTTTSDLGGEAKSVARSAAAQRWIPWTALALMTVSSVASLRPAPTMAIYGLASVFLYVLPAIVFLIPTALVSAELASGWKGGVYRWVTEGMSPRWGFTAAWHQFAMTIFYYPTLLSFVASTLAYVFLPELAASGVYTAIMIIVIYWAGVLLTLRGGIGIIAKLASSGVLIGTIVPGALLVILGIVYLAQGNPSAAPMDAQHILPEWTGIASIVLIVSNFMAYTGMEMNAVHVSGLKDPPRQFPKAMFLATGLVLLILILPPLAISWIVPAEQISLTAGVMQAFEAVLGNFGLEWLTPIIGIAIVAASLAGFVTWLAGPSRSLLLVAKDGGYLPPYLQKTNKVGVQQNILVVQGFVTTVLALLFALVPAVSNAYWIFMTITTAVYLLMYLWLFIAAMRLRKLQPDHPRGYRAPMLPLLCVVGFAASVAAIIISFVPPSQFGGGNEWLYIAIVGGGILLLGVLIPLLLFWLRKPSWKVAESDADAEVG